MKRILSVLLVLVMIIGMLPMTLLTASAAEETATLDFTNESNRISSTTTQQVWEQNGITFTYEKGSYNNNLAEYAPIRVYAGTKVTIAYPGATITKIEVTVNASKYAEPLKNSISSTDTVATSGTTVTITPADASSTYTIEKISAQTRFNNLTVYATVSDTECAHANTVEVPAVDATCTNSGYSAGVQCTDCGEYTSGHEIVDALGHSYGEFVVITEAACISAGSQKKTCAACGDEVTEAIAATGHSYGEDGICATCGAKKTDAASYKEVTVETITAGNYIIAGQRSAASYPNVYPATATCSADWTVINDAVAVTDGVITSDLFAGAQVFVLTGDNTNGFTIGYNNGTEMVYLGVSDYTANRKLAFSADYNNVLWTLVSVEKGGYALTTRYTKDDGTAGTYAISDNSTGTASIRGYASGTTYYGIYLFKEVTGGDPSGCAHEDSEEVEEIAATCTNAGYTAGKYCNDCESYISGGEEIPALGHNYVNGTCSACGAADPSFSTNPTATINFATTDQRVSQDTNAQVWRNAGLTVTNNKGTGSNVANYSNPVRFYKNSEIIIAYPQMNKIVIDSAANSGTEAKNQYFTNLVNDLKTGNVTTNGTIITIELTKPVDTYTITLTGGQARWFSITVYAAAGTCVHEVSEWNTTVPATCEAAGTQTGTCSKCNETVENDIPALGHAYSYNAEVGKMVCANCGDAFMNTIAEAKAYTDTNKVYYFKGIVTYVSGKTVYVQDDTAGVCVYFTNADNAAGIAAGDELLVWDTMTTYGGLIETTYTTSADIQILSSGNELPAAQSATLTELLANPSKYQGSRVTISGMTMGKINTSGNTVMTAAEGGTINLYQAKGMADNVTENDIVDITVVFSIYSNAYQLLLNQSTATTDVVVTTEGAPSDLALSDISAAKAGTEGAFFKVKGIVTFVDNASVYMQDATGGIVARLATGVTAPAIGAEIEAIGAYTTYNGLIQLEGATFTQISADNTVAAKETTVADLLAGAASNALLSEKISLKNVTVKAVGSYSATYKNLDYTVVDENGNEIKLYRTPLVDEANKLVVGDVINVIAVVSTYNGYQLRVVEESDITLLPTVEITHISLNPAKDALGYKAEAKNLPEGAHVEISLWVNENIVVTKATSALRLVNIMACNGGEMTIYAKATIVDGAGNVIAESVVEQTTMKETIKAVNALTDLTSEEKAAVGAYYEKYQSVMSTWFAADETNNIVAWIPTTEESTPAE